MYDFVKKVPELLKRSGKEPLTFSINDERKTNWDLFVMILATYNCFEIPLGMAFNPKTLEKATFRALSPVIDLFFLIDIVVSFRTTFIDLNSGQEIRDVKAIQKNYLKTHFTIDLLATVPFDLLAELILGNAGLFRLLGVLKLIRVLRLHRIITYLRTDASTKAALMLFKLVFYLLMYVHCWGCFWWMLVARERRWIPIYDYDEIGLMRNLYSGAVLTQYSSSIHAAMLAMTGNCIGPRTTSEILMGSLGLFSGQLIQANVFGELSVLITAINSKNN